MKVLEQGTIDSIEYKIVLKKHKTISAEVKCPKCGEWGSLIVIRSHTSKSFKILHNKKYCYVRYTSDCYDAVDQIWKIRNEWQMKIRRYSVLFYA